MRAMEEPLDPAHEASAATRRLVLFLEEAPEGERVRLSREELDHARVLRLAAGDACEGLDGAGRRWPLRVTEVRRGVPSLAVVGPEVAEPRPGEPGAELPWIELAVAWPRKNRAEPMIGDLVQLGAAAITPLSARYRGPEPCPEEPPARWAKLAREALKQCGRSWAPVLAGALTTEGLLEARPGAVLGLFDPGRGMSLDTWLRSLRPTPAGVGTQERPLVLVVGPEGGFAPEERDALLRAGATTLWLGPHVLRVETAARAAMAVCAAVLGSPDPRGSAHQVR
jgi:16S rRNA (uracil1498-N3)-methyltransferase